MIGSMDQRRDGIGPPPAYERVQQQPPEEDRGEPGAERRLRRIGFERLAADRLRYAPLRADEERHHDQRSRGEDDADGAFIRRLAADECLPAHRRF